MTDEDVFVFAEKLVGSLRLCGEEREHCLSLALFTCWTQVNLCRQRGVRPLKLNLWLAMKRAVHDHWRKEKRHRDWAKRNVDEPQTLADPLAKLLLEDEMKSLTPLQRRLLKMKYIRGLTLREIAGKLGISYQAVWQALFKAKNELRRNLEKGERGQS